MVFSDFMSGGQAYRRFKADPIKKRVSARKESKINQSTSRI